MWGGNLENYFKDAIETKTINDWMLSVAPAVSHEYVFIYFYRVGHVHIYLFIFI